MYTPISDPRRWLAGPCLALLAGCAGPGGLDLAGPSFRGGPVEAMRVAGREVVVQGPPGYCIDRSTAQDRAAGSVVMLGSCAILKETGDSPESPAVLTALVSPPSGLPLRPTPEQLEQFFRAPEGRAALAHDGQAASVTVLRTRAEDDVLFLTVRDTSRSALAELDELSWRAVFPLSDRLVALSVSSHAERPVSEAEARRTLDLFVAAMKAANPPLRPQARPDEL